jgi:hypothetical protein
MSGGVDRTRRAVLATAACALLASASAFAQDPRAALVQRAARAWLALADQLDADATWKTAGERLQQAIGPAQWAEVLKRDRAPRGANLQRAVAMTSFGSEFPGLPEGGNYALVHFQSSFANQAAAEEHVTLEVGADYAWHVIGYVIL